MDDQGIANVPAGISAASEGVAGIKAASGKRKSLTVEAARVAKVGAVLRDKVIRGLHLRCFPTNKVYYLCYRTKLGRRRNQKIGEFNVLTLEEARDKARAILRAVALGEDPAAALEADRGVPTLSELWSRYAGEHKLRANTLRDYKNRWDRVVEKAVGRHRMNDLTERDMRDLHEALKAGDGLPYEANRALALVSSMYSFARVKKVYTGTNPCSEITPYPEHARRRYMTEPEFPRLAAALASHTSWKATAGIAFIKLALFTGARCNELAALDKAWMRDGYAEMPETQMKNGEPGRIYFNTQAMAVIDALPKGDARVLGIATSPNSLWPKVRVEAGFPDLRLHDLRRTYASVGVMSDVPSDVISLLLNHKLPGVVGIYGRLMEKKAREAAQKIGDAIEKLLTADPQTSAQA